MNKLQDNEIENQTVFGNVNDRIEFDKDEFVKMYMVVAMFQLCIMFVLF